MLSRSDKDDNNAFHYTYLIVSVPVAVKEWSLETLPMGRESNEPLQTPFADWHQIISYILGEAQIPTA